MSVRTVRLDVGRFVADGSTGAVVGAVTFQPTRRVGVEGVVVLPAAVEAVLGQTVDLQVTGPGWGYSVDVLGAVAGTPIAASWCVIVPAGGEVPLSGLPEVKARSFDVVPPVAWMAELSAAIEQAADLTVEVVTSREQAALSAGAASGSATASAGSATASQTARTGAEGARDAAAGSATTAGQHATQAGQSAATAATERQAAQTARTGSETAQTASQAARDLALTYRDQAQAATFTGTAIGDVHLDTLTTPGVYRLSNAAFATLANGYPSAPNGGGWIVTVSTSAGPGAGAGLVQRLVRTFAADAGRLEWIRTKASAAGSWVAFRPLATQRTDKTAGIAIYTYDELALREQLVYGDTGRRDIGALIPVQGVVTALSQVILRRKLYDVTLNIVGLSKTGGSETYTAAIPAGFRPAEGSVMGVGGDTIQLVHGTAVNDGRMLIRGANTVTNGGLSMKWDTNDAWPTSLPGSALSAIPNT